MTLVFAECMSAVEWRQCSGKSQSRVPGIGKPNCTSSVAEAAAVHGGLLRSGNRDPASLNTLVHMRHISEQNRNGVKLVPTFWSGDCSD